MARIKLTLSANAGGALQLGSHRLLIDALHNKKVPGFSTLEEASRQVIFTHPDFIFPELICLTHTHADHYSKSMTDEAMARWTGTKCLMPEPLQQRTGDLEVAFLPLIHDGAAYENTPHYGILLTWQGKNILISGDCRIADEALIRSLMGKQIDLAIMNFPWLTLRKGRECLQTVIKPKHCVFWHLPFLEDDVNGYRSSAEAALRQYPGRLLCDPFQTIELDI